MMECAPPEMAEFSLELAMTDTLKDHIKKNISRYYRRRIIWPAAALAFLVILSFILPVRTFLFPESFAAGDSPRAFYNSDKTYVNCYLKGLYFTGYRKQLFGNTTGYYYYTMSGNDCIIVLLTGATCDQGTPSLDMASFDAKIEKNSPAEDKLLNYLARDLSWSGNGITKNIQPFLLSEPASTNALAVILRWLLLIFIVYASITLVLNIVYTLLPELAPPVQRLYVYGHPGKLLEQAENELSTLPQLATEDMYITQHFFIETSNYGIAIVPISAITWIYKYSTLHKFLWHVSAISYTLYITTNHHQVIRCPKNIKSDIDGVMDYLAEANHSILVGFNEKNREAARRMEDSHTVLERLKKFWGQKL